MLNKKNIRYTALTAIAFLIIWGFFLSSCTKYYYGSAANKAFCKPLEREYTRYERMIKRNGGNDPNYPYILKGRLIDQDSNELYYGRVHLEGSLNVRSTNPDGTFQFSIADSQFVKNKYVLSVEYEGFQPAEFIFRKKDFKNNNLDTTLIIYRIPIMLD